MPISKTFLGAATAGLLMAANPFAAHAQSMLGLDDTVSSVPGGGVLGSIPGIGGLFGGSDRAKESTQIKHVAINEAGNAARLAELLKHTESWMQQLMTMPGAIAGNDVAQFQWMLAELGRVRQSMAEIVYDPAGYGSYERYNEFRALQQGRSAERLDKVAAGMENLEARADLIGNRSAELMASNAAAQGGIQAQQIGNEAAGLNVEMQRQQLVLMAEMLRAQNEAEARELENQLLANERWCTLNPELESCGGVVP